MPFFVWFMFGGTALAIVGLIAGLVNHPRADSSGTYLMMIGLGLVVIGIVISLTGGGS